MALHTAFTRLVGCNVPIQLAPMGGIPTPALIAAVNEAGGMGALGAGPMPAEALAATLGQVRAHTVGPLAVNILMPFLTSTSSRSPRVGRHWSTSITVTPTRALWSWSTDTMYSPVGRSD